MDQFKAQTLVAVKVITRAYHMSIRQGGMKGKRSYSLRMDELDFLDEDIRGPPSTPSRKRDGTVLVSPCRPEGGIFTPEL